MRTERKQSGTLPGKPRRTLLNQSPTVIADRFARMATIALFLIVLMAPAAASAISSAPFRSPAVKRLAKNPIGAAVVVVIAVGAWAGSLLSRKRSATGIPSVPSPSSAPQPVPPPAAPTGAVGTAAGSGRGSDVGVGVVAPETAVPGENVMVQVAVDSAADLAAAIEKAKALDSANGAAERGSLVVRDVADGDVLRFRLDMPNLEVDELVQEHAWDGAPFRLQFFASVPGAAAFGAIPAKLVVSAGGRPVGRIGFVLNVVRAKPDGAARPAETFPHGYSQYFVSYSDKDIAQVVPRVQGMRIADRNLHLFLDKLSLAPGERYELEIFDFIDNRADVFLLFWSANSAASEWVEKEWRRALDRQQKKDGLPDIVPVLLARDAPPPPKELAHLHFGDGLLALAQDGH